jgi:hypothetical protein
MAFAENAWTAPMPKPAKGTAHDERVEKRKAVESYEDGQKRRVRLRDKRCRWPSCDCHQRRDRIEVAHIHDKGIGGDHGLRSSADQLICLCVARHQGRPSLHSGDLEVRPMRETEGTNGPCEFWRRDAQQQWYLVAREIAAFIYERD